MTANACDFTNLEINSVNDQQGENKNNTQKETTV